MLQITLWQRLMIFGLVALGLLFALPNGFYDRVESYNDARAAVEAGQSPDSLSAELAAWPGFLPSGLVNLGLDLRGGAHLLAEVQLEQVYIGRMDSLWPSVRDALRAVRETVGTVRRVDAPDGQLWVRIGEVAGLEAALAAVEALSQPLQTLTGVGQGTLDVSFEGDVIVVQLSDAEASATNDRTMAQSLEIIRRRVDEAGTREPTIQRQGEDRILIQVPGIASATELKELIGTTAQLSFNAVIGRTSDLDAPPGARNFIAPSIDEPGAYYILQKTPVVTGEELTDAQPAFDQNGRPAVNFRFNPTGARQFGDYTAENIGAPFAIVLDNEVISAPVIQSHIPGGSGIITGQFTVEDSTRLAVLLRAGALPAEVTYLEERTVGPELGQDSIDAGSIAAVIAFVAVLVFMAVSYGAFGVFANIALVINVGMIFGLLSVIGATLTLPGIAGIVLTIGMAVDANVLVFERIREELKTAKGPARAIELGYQKALSAIIDANITTFLTAVILYVMGSGPVRGFAITLALGIITSVFTAIYVTRLLIVLWFDRRRPKSIEV